MRNEDAKSALMMAAGEGHTEVVKTLLAAGADPAAVDKDGETAHQKAVDDGHDATAEVLRNAISK